MTTIAETTEPEMPMESDLIALPCRSEALFEARANLYRPPVVRLVHDGVPIASFAVLAGACPLKVVSRLGFHPFRLFLRRGALGLAPCPDEVVFEVARVSPSLEAARHSGHRREMRLSAPTVTGRGLL